MNASSKSLSDNPKSAMQNLKWLGLSVIAFVLVVTGAVAEAQQSTTRPKLGWLGARSGITAASGREIFRREFRELGYVEGKT